MTDAIQSQEQRLWDWPLQGHDGVVKVTEDDKHFEVGLDATYFSAKDISVKVIGDLLDINFEHEIKGDTFGSVKRQISRAYRLPEKTDPKTIKSNLSNNILFISGQKKQ